jgi:hypothetical protein
MELEAKMKLNNFGGSKTVLSGVDFGAAAEADFLAQAKAALAATTYTRAKGVPQIFQKVVQQVADVGDYILATVTTAPVLIKSVTIKAVTAAQSELTSCGIFTGAAKNVTLVAAAVAIVASLDSIDDQVSASALAVELAAAKTIVMTLAGTGHAAGNVNLLVTIEYVAVTAGGYLA